MFTHRIDGGDVAFIIIIGVIKNIQTRRRVSNTLCSDNAAAKL